MSELRDMAEAINAELAPYAAVVERRKDLDELKAWNDAHPPWMYLASIIPKGYWAMYPNTRWK